MKSSVSNPGGLGTLAPCAAGLSLAVRNHCSRSKTDKSELFKVFYGELGNAPLIAECPVCMSCAVYDAVKLPSNTLFIGEPKEVFTEEKYMTDNLLDINKVNPLTLTMPDNHYWSVGESLGKAWSIGKNLRVKRSF